MKSTELVADRGHYAGQLIHLLEFDDLATRCHGWGDGEFHRRMATVRHLCRWHECQMG